MFGIGAARYQREHVALGVPYPPVRDRLEMLEETLQICAQMWSDDDGPYQGKHYQLAETLFVPQPIRKTAGLFTDPFTAGDSFWRTAEKFAALGFDLVNLGPLPSNPRSRGLREATLRRGGAAAVQAGLRTRRHALAIPHSRCVSRADGV